MDAPPTRCLSRGWWWSGPAERTVLLLEMGLKEEVPQDEHTVSLGQAEIKRPGARQPRCRTLSGSGEARGRRSRKPGTDKAAEVYVWALGSAGSSGGHPGVCLQDPEAGHRIRGRLDLRLRRPFDGRGRLRSMMMATRPTARSPSTEPPTSRLRRDVCGGVVVRRDASIAAGARRDGVGVGVGPGVGVGTEAAVVKLLAGVHGPSFPWASLAWTCQK